MTQRIHYERVVSREGEVIDLIMHDTPEITVRSLKEVGGDRPSRKYTRRLNRQARARGFSTFKSFVQFIAAHRQINQTEAFKYVQQAFR